MFESMMTVPLFSDWAFGENRRTAPVSDRTTLEEWNRSAYGQNQGKGGAPPPEVGPRD